MITDWHWSTEYNRDGVVDGTCRSVELVYNDLRITPSGSNCYPDKDLELADESAYSRRYLRAMGGPGISCSSVEKRTESKYMAAGKGQTLKPTQLEF